MESPSVSDIQRGLHPRDYGAAGQKSSEFTYPRPYPPASALLAAAVERRLAADPRENVPLLAHDLNYPRTPRTVRSRERKREDFSPRAGNSPNGNRTDHGVVRDLGKHRDSSRPKSALESPRLERKIDQRGIRDWAKHHGVSERQQSVHERPKSGRHNSHSPTHVSHRRGSP
eukprot:TRINITY_DN28519_c0_g1_i1.p1 TRINITY_DN28519_c0_g1~~TRINITY_DN28519_c0_g1_i1.p1  ORF type:complete len:172 (+),score=6.45 TRINITY_DN28519_c0_g1_i1:149-664(+)